MLSRQTALQPMRTSLTRTIPAFQLPATTITRPQPNSTASSTPSCWASTSFFGPKSMMLMPRIPPSLRRHFGRPSNLEVTPMPMLAWCRPWWAHSWVLGGFRLTWLALCFRLMMGKVARTEMAASSWKKTLWSKLTDFWKSDQRPNLSWKRAAFNDSDSSNWYSFKNKSITDRSQSWIFIYYNKLNKRTCFWFIIL